MADAKDSKEQKKQIVKAAPQSEIFSCIAAFEDGQRIAQLLAKSDLVPEAFRGNIPNTLIALEIANRMSISPLAVLQNLYIVHGKPFWNSSFIIASINSSKRFKGLNFEMSGEGEKRQCVAYAIDRETNEKIEAPAVSIEMARKEGLFDKRGSKWITRAELMLRYRAATLFGRLFAPEILYGMSADNEVDEEIQEAEVVE